MIEMGPGYNADKSQVQSDQASLFCPFFANLVDSTRPAKKNLRALINVKKMFCLWRVV